MEDKEVKLTHYQRYKEVIYKNVLKAQKRKRDIKIKIYEQEIIDNYLKAQLESN